ncbi:ethanolamine ammonia-lyase subunit EutC [Endozoicomonas acroporae]|uniref:ethanolamine ammonia-lyase subunit EutC n=1 Tax=Endozoicomonas acroporae TaxID=1701104 RepID=UPI0023EA4F63|nr:ethanolamine ammonia-lyase subunit EutC [Endozoicomonas acroporae]
MLLKTKLFGKVYSFSSIKEVLAKANEKRSGDVLAGIAAESITEMIAAVAKLMTNVDLIYAASKIEVLATCNTTIGRHGTLAARLQPNHTTDNVDGIRISTLEGLSYGMGDAVIGLNPVDDTTDSIYRCLHQFEEIKQKFEIPTQNCVLAHVLSQMEAVERGAPAGMIFQSIAGSQKGNEAAKTPARLGIGKAGPRYETETMLRFRADHAVAIDSVFNEVAEAFITETGLIAVSSKCDDKDMYVTRPDLGRMISDEGVAKIQSECRKGADVQIVIADGLSSSAITANLKNILPALQQGLEGYGLSVGDPVFIKFGRVGAMDHLTDLVNSKVTVMLVGERPGLATGESMGAYITYEGKVGMAEAGRTVISNIHRRGTPAAEAGAHIANIVKKMFEQKCSGVGFRF